jgi:plastocyanin
MAADAMNPGCIQVPRGASVEFVNQDREMHTATDQAAPPAFDLDVPAGTSARTPALGGPAVVEAACTFHPAMRVTILVP